jgi:hypothetical protein
MGTSLHFSDYPTTRELPRTVRGGTERQQHFFLCNLQQFGVDLRCLASAVRWRPAAERMIFFSGLAGPAVDAVEGKPDGVDVDERQQNDAKPDEHTEATEVAPSQSGDGQ